jgi:hypothetical protein
MISTAILKIRIGWDRRARTWLELYYFCRLRRVGKGPTRQFAGAGDEIPQLVYPSIVSGQAGRSYWQFTVNPTRVWRAREQPDVGSVEGTAVRRPAHATALPLLALSHVQLQGR